MNQEKVPKKSHTKISHVQESDRETKRFFENKQTKTVGAPKSDQILIFSIIVDSSEHIHLTQSEKKTNLGAVRTSYPHR